MSVTNEEIINRYLDALNRQDWTALASCLCPALIRHSVATPDREIKSSAGFIRFLQENAGAFPDLFHRIEMIVSEKNLVACYLRLTGTQTGPLGPIHPTGKQIDMPFLSFFRIEDGKIAEMWVEWDNVCFLSQLGLIPQGWPMDPPESADGDKESPEHL